VREHKRPDYVLIPDTVFRDRSVSVMESMVRYLKEDRGFSYHDIGKLLNRDERTVWTVYSRCQKKAVLTEKGKNI
jgi:hypothetical protein